MSLTLSTPRCTRAVVRLALALMWGLAGLLLPSAIPAADNSGLGPVSLRNFFPPRLPFLQFTPERTATLAVGRMELIYQHSLANTLINTQLPDDPRQPVITQTEVARGLIEADFPAQGYGAYIDAEMVRRALTWRYGWGPSLEVGLDLAWLTLSGGAMDSTVERVETMFGGYNDARDFSARNRFDYYLIYNGRFVTATSTPALEQMQDPVLNL